MIDAEVIRLRNLRNLALKTRALARVLAAHDSDSQALFSRTALACWRIARTASGRLRAHPFIDYQRGPSALSVVNHRWTAALSGSFAHYRHHSMDVCLRKLRVVAEQLADARALTWSTDLSDDLGRFQSEIRVLMNVMDGHTTSGSVTEGAISRREAGELAAEWPYLAI